MARPLSSVFSMLFGRFASHAFSPSIQRFINRSYAGLMRLDMSEFDTPESYPALNALFTRELKKEREINPDPAVVISPCDSMVTECGTVKKRQAYQIKGMSYDTACLLGPEYTGQLSLLEGGSYINLYLSPKDYHRYHMPFDASVIGVTHIPGKLYPVNMPLLKYRKGLFIENERVVVHLKDKSGAVHFIVLVGALNVGRMILTFEERLKTNISDRKISHFDYERPVEMRKGELFGWFEMGSTIVMLSQAGTLSYADIAKQKIRFADTIGKLVGASV